MQYAYNRLLLGMWKYFVRLGFASPFRAPAQSISPLALISKPGTRREWQTQKRKAFALIIILVISWRALPLSIAVMLGVSLLDLLELHRPTGTRVNMTPRCPTDIASMFNQDPRRSLVYTCKYTRKRVCTSLFGTRIKLFLMTSESFQVSS